MDVEILVEGEGLENVEIIHIPHGSSVQEIVIAVAEKGKFAPTDAFLFYEDEEEPLELSIVLDEQHDHKRIHHVHRSKTVEVVVHYGTGEKTHHFAPSTRVERILEWAIGPQGFAIDPAIAPEMELAVEGSEDELPGSAHIGRYARHGHRVELNLIRGVIPNGGAL